MVRMSADLAEMVTAVAEHEGSTSAEVLDPLIRPAVEARFAGVPQWMRDRLADRMARLAARTSAS
jgi:hypothetical protein